METHSERSKKASRPCEASHMTFGGRCLNCGFGETVTTTPPEHERKNMSVKMRQLVEREIATAIVRELLVIGGFSISVDNGDNSGRKYEISRSLRQSAVMKAMFLTDEDRLYVEKGGEIVGWVYLVYGNDGWDVLSDYTVNLDKFIGNGTAVQKIIDKYAD